MLDSFEARLTDLVADELTGVTALQLVTRPRGDLAAVADEPGRAVVVVSTLAATAAQTLGDNGLERRGATGAYQLWTTLRLTGQVALDVVVRAGGGEGLETRRLTVLTVLDRLLVALQSEAVRHGRAFRTDVDLGFELDGFRLAGIGPLAAEEGGFALPAELGGIRATYDFSGRFWPVEEPPAGDLITGLPTRVAVLPALAPERLHTAAGSADLRIPVGLDLRAVNGAGARVMARLKGASPPGTLVGDAAGAPPPWVGYPLAEDGVVTVVYRPPAALASAARVYVALALDQGSRPAVGLAELAIEVASG